MSTPATEYPVFSPYITVRNADKAIEFYKSAFGASELFRLANSSDGKVGHAELMIENNLLMLSEENPQWGTKSPQALGGSPVSFCLMVENADAAFDRAVAAGATAMMPVSDQFYGFRSGSIVDPFGHQWMLQHKFEDVSPAEMQKRWTAMEAECESAEKP